MENNSQLIIPPIDEWEEPTGIAKCLKELKYEALYEPWEEEAKRWDEVTIALPRKDAMSLAVFDVEFATELDGERREITSLYIGNDYEVRHVAVNLDRPKYPRIESRRLKRRFAKILSISPEPPFVILIEASHRGGHTTSNFTVIRPNCTEEVPVLRKTGLSFTAAVVDGREYLLPLVYTR